jgi:microcystin-dependent protein
MSAPFVGEIRLFGGNFAPAGWNFCDGSILPINGNEVLFALIGTTYGGNGTTNFALPDLRGRLPMGQGAGPNLTPRTIGQTGGQSTVQLTSASVPTHTHAFNVVGSAATTLEATPGIGLAQPSGGAVRYVPPTAAGATVVQMAAGSITYAAGASQAHPNVMPCLAIQYMICLNGLFPTRP